MPAPCLGLHFAVKKRSLSGGEPAEEEYCDSEENLLATQLRSNLDLGGRYEAYRSRLKLSLRVVVYGGDKL